MQGDSAEAQRQKRDVKGFVFYPTSFHITEGDYMSSYAKGVSEGGRECIVYIHPESHHIESAKHNTAKSIPSFEDFADAEPPCEAYPDNGPTNVISAILMEQAEQSESLTSQHGLPVMVAKWASILKLNERAIRPPTGYGYLEISCMGSGEEHEHLKGEIAEIQRLIDAKSGDMIDLEQRRDQAVQRYYDLSRCFFSVVMMNYKKPRAVKSEEQLRAALQSIASQYTQDGRFAGALIRVRDERSVYLQKCSTFEVRYDSKAGAIENFDDAYARFMRFGGRAAVSQSGLSDRVVEIIPAQRINMGPRGVERYKKDLCSGMQSKTMKTFVEGAYHCQPQINLRAEKAFLYTRVAVRMARVKKGAGKGNQIVSSVHAYAAPRGNAFQIDIYGAPSYKVIR